MAKKATAAAPWQWNKDANDSTKDIVSKDGGKSWAFATPAEVAARDAEAANAPPVPAGATTPGPTDTPIIAQDGKTAKVGDETLDIAGQVPNMDGTHKEAAISLHSPTDAKGNPVIGEGDYERMYKEANARADRAESENKRLRVVNEQLMNANEVANKHLKELQGQTFDSLGLPKTPGL